MTYSAPQFFWHRLIILFAFTFVLSGQLIPARADDAPFPVYIWGEALDGVTNIPVVLTNGVKQVACGINHTVVLRTDGTVLAWGGNSLLQTNVPVGLSNVIAISSGWNHNLALKVDGTLAEWGWYYNAADATDFAAVAPAGLSNIVAISAGANHDLAIRRDGTALAWGARFGGKTNVPPGFSNIVAVAGGTEHSLLLQANGTVTAWGSNQFGQTNVPAGLSNVIMIAAGGNFSVALKADGSVVAWGDNGDGHGQQTNVPAGLTNAVMITAGEYHSMALCADGSVVAWGYDLFNQFGQTNVPPGLTNVTAVGAGGRHSIVVQGTAPYLIQSPLMDPKLGNNNFQTSLATQSGRVFRMEYQASLGDTNWTALPLVAGTGDTNIFTDNSATDPQRFYRIRRW